MELSGDREKKSSGRSGSVQSVERALSLLELLSAEEAGLRLTELSARAGLSPSTAHRLLTTLEKRRFVQFDRLEGVWHVGQSAFSVGAAFVRRRNFVAAALPFLRRLRDRTRETANLGVLDEGEVVVLTQVESREIMRAITRIGGRAPMAASGLGKAMLATCDPEQAEALIAHYGLPRVTGARKSSLEALREELARARRDGYAVDDEEFVPGLRCVAAPVLDHRGDALCAISISGLATRVTRDRVPELGALVADCARDLTRALGGPA